MVPNQQIRIHCLFLEKEHKKRGKVLDFQKNNRERSSLIYHFMFGVSFLATYRNESIERGYANHLKF